MYKSSQGSFIMTAAVVSSLKLTRFRLQEKPTYEFTPKKANSAAAPAAASASKSRPPVPRSKPASKLGGVSAKAASATPVGSKIKAPRGAVDLNDVAAQVAQMKKDRALLRRKQQLANGGGGASVEKATAA